MTQNTLSTQHKREQNLCIYMYLMPLGTKVECYRSKNRPTKISTAPPRRRQRSKKPILIPKTTPYDYNQTAKLTICHFGYKIRDRKCLQRKALVNKRDEAHASKLNGQFSYIKFIPSQNKSTK